jgi:hypothetical protein
VKISGPSGIMHLGMISLADRVVENIKSDDVKQEILKDLNASYGIKIIQKHDHRLDEKNIEYVKNNPHLVSLRSNGNRYILYFTLYNDIEIIYLIDLKIHSNYTMPRITLIRGLFGKELFKNTIIYCEMVKSECGWICLFNDIIVHKGIHLTKMLLPDRLKVLYDILENDYMPDKIIDICQYKVKTYYHACDESIEALMKLSESLNYTSRGIYFWPYDLKYKPKLYNFDENKIVPVVRKVKDDNSFKTYVKPAPQLEQQNDIKKEVKIDNQPGSSYTDIGIFYISKSNEPDIYNLYETDNILISKKIGIALIPNLATSKMIRETFKNKNLTTTVKVKCAYNQIFNKWYPLQLL